MFGRKSIAPANRRLQTAEADEELDDAGEPVRAGVSRCRAIIDDDETDDEGAASWLKFI